MKKLTVVVLAVGLVVGAFAPRAVLAGSSTDAALGLGAFAVFNQIIGGTGIFARPAPVFVSPPPAVVIAPPVPVVEERYYYPPTPGYYYPPAPAYYAPPPVYYSPSRVVIREGWCPPGLAKQGRCGGYRRHWEDDD